MTAGCHMGSERKRSISPFLRSSARPSAVTNPPKTIDWTMIPGIRKSTYSRPGVAIAPPKT
jgi:hypothetical protein